MAAPEPDDLHLQRFRKLPRSVRVVYARPRLFVSAAIGMLAFWLMPATLRPVTRMLLAWDGLELT